ncbi:hypothetical protein PWT90_08522 [Aphanocladium album]|nr:hypothetical protein PWT90_08522 [Aphanocladium album]
MSAPLFELPIGACNKQPGGTLTCTEPQDKVYLLTWNSPPDNRLTTPFCKALLAALDILEYGGYAPGVVVTTSSIAKNYSNGFDLEHTLSNKDVFFPFFYNLWVRFLTYPMPTVALMNGHCYAAGLMLAMAHDYRLAPTPRGFFCLPELTYGLPLTPAMVAIFRHKIGPTALRDLTLEAAQLTGQQVVDMGVADGLAAGPLRFKADGNRAADRVEFGKVWYEQWKAGKAKL